MTLTFAALDMLTLLVDSYKIARRNTHDESYYQALQNNAGFTNDKTTISTNNKKNLVA